MPRFRKKNEESAPMRVAADAFFAGWDLDPATIRAIYHVCEGDPNDCPECHRCPYPRCCDCTWCCANYSYCRNKNREPS